jgi:hypothetical protein
MRPVQKPHLSLVAAEASRGALLLAALGPYCSICERPMPAEFWLLDKTTGRILEPDVTHADWASLLLICHDCAAAHQRGSIQDLDQLLFPDVHDTFDLQSPALRYDLEERVLYIELGPEREVSHETPLEAVIVYGETEAATATIEHFALNTPYWVAERQAMIVPWEDQSTRFDRRVFLRTAAWTAAGSLLPEIREGLERRELHRESPLIQARQRVVAATGFWSTFASAYRELPRDLVLDLLVPEASRVYDSARLPTVQQEGFAGAATATFPGTRVT